MPQVVASIEVPDSPAVVPAAARTRDAVRRRGDVITGGRHVPGRAEPPETG